MLTSALLRFAVSMLLVVAAAAAGYWRGVHQGAINCKAGQMAAVQQAQQTVATTAVEAIALTVTTGRQHEAKRAAITRQFETLTTQAAHDKPMPVDDCVLPAERLQRWADANAGAADTGAAPGQPDNPAAPAATARVGPDARPGGQPPPSGPGLPPAGQPDVQPADVFESAP